MNEEHIMHAFEQVRSYRKGNRTAPHKDLLLLYMLGRCWHFKSRHIPFVHAESHIWELLCRFGFWDCERESVRDPFWYLAHDRPRVWELRATGDLATKLLQRDRPSFKAMLASDLSGGFPEYIHRRLVHDKVLLMKVVYMILERFLPSTLHAEMLSAIGFPSYESASHEQFRSAVVKYYDYSCAVCHFGATLEGQHICVDATHIKRPGAGGPHLCDNGIAFCKLHRYLFEIGAFTISDTHSIKLSKLVTTQGNSDGLLKYAGTHLRLPEDIVAHPRQEFVRWHNRFVFR